MRKFIYTILAAMAVPFLMASCLGDDTTETEYSSECSIVSFSINDIETTFTTKSSSGEDSTYTVTCEASDYEFCINQFTHEVYNVDSLPYQTDVTKVLCSISADGTAIINQDGEWATISSDSLDFTNPLTIRIMANDAKTYMDYKVSVLVHQKDPDATEWHHDSEIWAGKALEKPRSLVFGDKVAVYGTEGSSLKVTFTDSGSPSWSDPVQVAGLSAKARYGEAVYFGGLIYIVDEGKLLASQDGMSFSSVGNTLSIDKLAGCSSKSLYAISGGKFQISQDGIAWTEEQTEYPKYLPSGNIFHFHRSLSSGQETISMMGYSPVDTDSCCVAWYRLGDNDTWGYMNTATDNLYRCPMLDNLTVLDYHEYLIAIGLKSLRGYEDVSPLGAIYVSKDCGLTFKTQDDEEYDTYPTLPDDIKGLNVPFAAYVDKECNIWIMFTGSGDMWHGRLNRIAFEYK